MIQTVIVDLVGVFIHVNARKIFFRLGLWNLASYVLRYRANPINEVFRLLDAMRLQGADEYQDVISYRGNLLPRSFCEFQRGKLSSEECLRRVYNFFNQARSDGFFISRHQEQCIQHFMTIIFTPREVAQFFEIDKRVYDFLQELKSTGDYQCYLFSNIDAEAFASIQERFALELQVFDGMVTSYGTGYLKPEQEIYDILYQRFSIDPTRALYLDDQYDNIEAAQEHGVHGVHYRRRTPDLDQARKICQ
jgi:FMN phosphatase YigB (HAD superfamily)